MTSTARLYVKAQESFLIWCADKRQPYPASHEMIARYLRDTAQARGPSTAPVHLAAIARLYRTHGGYLDTKSFYIQTVMTEIRAEMRRRSRERMAHDRDNRD